MHDSRQDTASTISRESLQTPASCFGVTPGDDRVLVRWDAMLDYFDHLAAHSDRLVVERIGQSTEGRDLVLLAIAAPEVIASLDTHRQRRTALMDPVRLADPALADGTAAGDRTVVLVTSAIHATEVGSVQLCPELAFDLVTRNDADTARMLAETIVLIVPTLNPDGMDLVHNWYDETLGTEQEGTSPPALYHRYAGHDNNRDWMHHRLAETRVLVERVHKPWRPHMVLDLHQMYENGSRYFVPPYIDPIEPNVDPRLIANGSALGNHIAARMAAKGQSGVATGLLFDAFSPSRAWSHYHGGVRILAEAASARIASPVTLTPDDLTVHRDFDPRLPRIGYPMPWTSGEWRLHDIMDYHREAVLATIDHAARNRETWLADQWAIFADAVTAAPDHAYVIPPLEHQLYPAAARDLLAVLQRGEVVLERLIAPETDADGKMHARGSWLVRPGQPAFSWANVLLPSTAYSVATGDNRPYDVTTHSLAVHLGVEASVVTGWEDWASEPAGEVETLRLQPLETPRLGNGRWLTVDGRSHAAVQFAMEARKAGGHLRRLASSHLADGRLLDPGTWVISGIDPAPLLDRAAAIGVRVGTTLPIADGLLEQRVPKIGVFLAPTGEATDAGWVRLTLETLGIPHTVVDLDDIASGGAVDALDVLLLPHLGKKAYSALLADASEPARPSSIERPRFAKVLRHALERGLRIVAIDGSAAMLVELLGLPVEMPLAESDDATFFSPGAMVRTSVSTNHPLGWGMDRFAPALLTGKNAFRRTDSTLPVPVRFEPDQAVISGWVQGADHLSGLDAVVDVPVARGHITLFAIRPHYRAQVAVTLNLLTNALLIGGLEVPA
ncbi:MAG: M14 family zinc carboxypeptidase [Thermomicrobiales bacterium]